mmetsp:Transcript_25754/g.36094  ORF Transcript_25754/g.36094 Transcript_25754/m.36094 type:complete len:80 (-) Transcript_25754:726-965(-)
MKRNSKLQIDCQGSQFGAWASNGAVTYIRVRPVPKTGAANDNKHKSYLDRTENSFIDCQRSFYGFRSVEIFLCMVPRKT